MAAPVAMSPDVMITIKVQYGLENRRIKLPLRELGANTLPEKLREQLQIEPARAVLLERYSDSAGTYVTLNSDNPAVYKQLYRAAKAKLKLRIKVTVSGASESKQEPTPLEAAPTFRLLSQHYVPPMNLDPLQISHQSQNPLAKAVANGTSAVTTPLPSIPRIQAMSDMQRNAYLQFIKESSAPLNGQNKSETNISTAPTAVEPKIETPVTVKQEMEEEAPLPRSFSEREQVRTELASFSKNRPACLRAVDQAFHVPGATFTVCCNKCNANIPDGHWHCSICVNGDYDLCVDCVGSGVHCGVEGHFLIRRSIENGKVINSVTQTVLRKAVKVETEKEIPGAYTHGLKEEQQSQMLEMTRTCNCCVNIFEESNFVTCMVCEDYDLCIRCHVSLKHGHHPNHTFEPVSEESTLGYHAKSLCRPGRNMRHMAICDGCDKDIFGVRHKCLNCPDWDYCSTCAQSATHIHPGHRFVPIYESLAIASSRQQVHFGINCDGPLCQSRSKHSWITGDRYKCAVCHDTDFCASCEALPTNRHNRTHPLIKFRTPVRNVSVTTLGEKENGEAMCTMGDKVPQTSSKSTETVPAAQSANAATQVQTVAEVKPTEPAMEEIKEEPKEEKAVVSPYADLEAHFVCDTIADGSEFFAGRHISQQWTLRNPGPKPWPKGCSIRFIGGDNNMLNIDAGVPCSHADIDNATESNIVDRVVEVGEEVCFSVPLKIPQRPGNSISYWRLKAADGTPFGHKLWCDINVMAAPESMETEHVEYAMKEVTEMPTAVKEEPNQEEQGSQMIFPKLDKESPVSSQHEAQTNVAQITPPSPVGIEEQQLIDDVESLELDGETSDDGFFTDEEYEILDASTHDEQAINGKK